MMPARKAATGAITLGVAMMLSHGIGLAAGCPPDSVPVGPTCVDKYEASLWTVPAQRKDLIGKIRRGRATLSDLQRGGGTWVGCEGVLTSGPPAYPATFPPNGNWSEPVYAVSIPGVRPSTCMTWFQAGQACAISGKRLLTNAEWQMAAAGTPDPPSDDGVTTCNVDTSTTPATWSVPTGSRYACVSRWGASDMVGNVREWVSDLAASFGEDTLCGSTWPASYGGDLSCYLGEGPVNEPVALVRGGSWRDRAEAGAFFLITMNPTYGSNAVGVRCAR